MWLFWIVTQMWPYMHMFKGFFFSLKSFILSRRKCTAEVWSKKIQLTAFKLHPVSGKLLTEGPSVHVKIKLCS